MIDFTEIVVALITLLGTVITGYIVSFLRSKMKLEKIQEWDIWVKIAVKAAEQMYPNPGFGEVKNGFVTEFLEQRGIKIDNEQVQQAIDGLIEAAVYELKQNRIYLTAEGDTYEPEKDV